ASPPGTPPGEPAQMMLRVIHSSKIHTTIASSEDLHNRYDHLPAPGAAPPTALFRDENKKVSTEYAETQVKTFGI
ncbi:hypothetical protein, partial [Alistipes sp.]